MSLEKIHDLHNHFIGPPKTKTKISILMHEQINLGTEKDSNFSKSQHLYFGGTSIINSII